MNAMHNRREFIQRLGLLTGLTATATATTNATPELFFQISLAQWSFHRALKSGRMDNLDFPVRARKEFDISAVEYVNVFFIDKAKDQSYLATLRGRCDDHGVTSMLIMCDAEGHLGDLDSSQRMKAVENHFKWVDAARFLGCHSIRVNCDGVGDANEVSKACIDGLRKLSEYAKTAGINVLAENHEGYSSNGQWMSTIVRSVGMPNCGTLPDFDNFNLGNNAWYDRYQGVKEMMPFAKAVSAKAINFDDQGNCLETDYTRMLTIVRESGYRGFIAVEYEGAKLSEEDGVRATKRLLERVGATLR
jgi:sugar phosphate isomerase/epimerase